MMFPGMPLLDKLQLLYDAYRPTPARVKEIPLNDYAKDLFKASDVFYYKPGDVQTSYKKAVDLSGDTVYYFPNLNQEIAYRITHALNPPRDPVRFIICYICQEEYLWS